ncbi:hypothetical protein AGRA3207_005987 [Actinomadura graeca]|uniref:Ig-like domain-containing protein n=1 Tax=Actinomadura graeca TaxID=2750812 RepID=A0ABX8R3S0_9ACTN|nr:hypothetical protein [Actinomadura graeca]QXJ24622.1 hypothetical protein AGRA3207_005987 [Actinomadura graeca]
MRRRFGAVLVLLTAVLGGLLTGAGAAQASDPVCRPTLTGTPEVICTVPADTDGRRIDFIQWTRDGASLPQFDDIRQILVGCTPGQTFVIGVTIGFIDDVEQSTGSDRVRCPGSTAPPPEITAFSCDQAGSEYYRHFDCYLSWTGGTDPTQVQISSNTNMGRRTNHYDQDYVTFQGTCRGVNNPYVSVTVFDAVGRRADASLSAFC